jgi:Zn-finger nucleic acid-binding protein
MPDATIACVKCKTKLDKSIVYDVEVDVCPRCGGMWLDQGEITALAGMPDSELADLRAIHLKPQAPPHIPAKANLKCPACPGTLKEIVLGSVWVDYCARCHGFHLDRGELDQAVRVARSKGGSAKQVLALAAKALATA